MSRSVSNTDSSLSTNSHPTGRYGERDAALILLAYRHGLRVAELVALTWHQVDLKGALLHVARRKNGTPSTQPLTGRELRALRALLRDAEGSPWVFNTERGASMTTDNVRKVIERAAAAAGLPGCHLMPYGTLAGSHWQTREPIPDDPGVPRQSEYSAHGPLHGVGTRALQGPVL